MTIREINSPEGKMQAVAICKTFGCEDEKNISFSAERTRKTYMKELQGIVLIDHAITYDEFENLRQNAKTHDDEVHQSN